MIRELRPSFPNSRIRLAQTLALFCALIALAAPAFASVLNSQEQAIANYMINDPNQGRPSLTLDPILASVARSRAEDMAKRNYFAHVNPDGHAANYLVQQAGYQLPSWWGNDPAANYIESIAAGYSTPQATWNGWMNSPDHRTHILGLNSFYASETYYGVGYYYDPNSTYKYYWVIITAPPQPAPKLAITSPAAGARVTDTSIAVAGTTASNSGATSVVYRVENASGTGTFKTASGVATWSDTATGLVSGTNTIRVRSLDANSNVIAELTRTVTYVQTGPLTIAISGSGSVTAGFDGTTTREVGKSYTITATPATGFLFSGWSGDITSSAATLTFTMPNSLNLTANFIVNSFIPLKGGYYGLVDSDTHPGFVRLALTPTGTFTGRVTINGSNYAVTGKFDINGAATVTIPRKNNTALTLNLQLDLTGQTGEITGTLSDGVFTANISADHAAYDGLTSVAPQAGRYTMVLAASGTDCSVAPTGSGYAVVLVAPNGVTTISGRLADNTIVSQSSMVSPNGTLPLYLTLTGEKGSVSGTVTLRDTDVSDVDGSLNWSKAANPVDVFYPNGFSTQLYAVGSRYVAPAKNSPPIAFTSGTAALGDGNIEPELDVPVTVTTTNKVAMATPGSLNFAATIARGNGALSGSFVHPGSKVTRGVRGVVLQKQNAVFGYFRGINETGYFSLSSAN